MIAILLRLLSAKKENVVNEAFQIKIFSSYRESCIVYLLNIKIDISPH